TGIAQSGGGSVTVSHTGAMSITGTVSTTGGGAVNLTSSAAMSESGAGFISTTGSLSAKTLNDAGAPIAFASTANGANSVALRARNAADTADAPGTISYLGSGAINIAGLATAAGATITGGGALTNSGAITVGGNASVNAGAADITLGSAAPFSSGSLTFVGGTVTIAQTSPTRLVGASNANSLVLSS